MNPQPAPSRSPLPSPHEFWMIQYLSGGPMPLLGQPTGSTPHPTGATAWFVSWPVHRPSRSVPTALPWPVTHFRSVRMPLHVSALLGYIWKRLSTCMYTDAGPLQYTSCMMASSPNRLVDALGAPVSGGSRPMLRFTFGIEPRSRDATAAGLGPRVQQKAAL